MWEKNGSKKTYTKEDWGRAAVFSWTPKQADHLELGQRPKGFLDLNSLSRLELRLVSNMHASHMVIRNEHDKEIKQHVS